MESVDQYVCHQSAISEIMNETSCWAHLLSWDNNGVVLPEALQKYADVPKDFGEPTSSVAQFINCIIHQTCYPGIF